MSHPNDGGYCEALNVRRLRCSSAARSTTAAAEISGKTRTGMGKRTMHDDTDSKLTCFIQRASFSADDPPSVVGAYNIGTVDMARAQSCSR